MKRKNKILGFGIIMGYFLIIIGIYLFNYVFFGYPDDLTRILGVYLFLIPSVTFIAIFFLFLYVKKVKGIGKIFGMFLILIFFLSLVLSLFTYNIPLNKEKINFKNSLLKINFKNYPNIKNYRNTSISYNKNNNIDKLGYIIECNGGKKVYIEVFFSRKLKKMLKINNTSADFENLKNICYISTNYK